MTPSPANRAVLLLHGLTGTPLDMAPLSIALNAEGYVVDTPLLPGRGTRPSDMYALRWDDWMSFAVERYDALAREHREVVIGGLSAGATMALDLALRRRPAALLLYSTALGMRSRLAYLAPFAWRVIPSWPSPPSDFVDPSAHTTWYDPAPVRAIAELLSGIRRVRGRLGEIASPALVAHALTDRHVPVAHARALARGLNGPVRTLFLEGTGHAITVDARREDVARASVGFLREYLDQSGTRSA